MAFGLGVLRLPADAFWSLTPRELMSALEGAQGRRAGETLSRATLNELMRAFPDGDLQ